MNVIRFFLFLWAKLGLRPECIEQVNRLNTAVDVLLMCLTICKTSMWTFDFYCLLCNNILWKMLKIIWVFPQVHLCNHHTVEVHAYSYRIDCFPQLCANLSHSCPSESNINLLRITKVVENKHFHGNPSDICWDNSSIWMTIYYPCTNLFPLRGPVQFIGLLNKQKLCSNFYYSKKLLTKMHCVCPWGLTNMSSHGCINRIKCVKCISSIFKQLQSSSHHMLVTGIVWHHW